MQYLKDTPQQEEAKEFAKGKMAEKLDRKPELVELLTPKFAVGCRRLTPGNGFLESLVCHCSFPTIHFCRLVPKVQS